MNSSPSSLPRHTSALPVRLSGDCKATPADFVVEEIPAYLPSGEGEHLYLWIEKCDVAAEQLLKHIARTLDISQGDIGCAGLKDRRAKTRQWVSVPAKLEHLVPQISTDRIQVLDQRRHGNKLRTGHLAGNRFSILVTQLRQIDEARAQQPVEPASLLEQLTPAIEFLATSGFANYFGDQRFGRDGETLQLGYDLLTGKATPRDIPYSRRKFLLKLAVSAVQSDLFNRALVERITDGLATTVLAGDVMELVASGGKFVAEDVAMEQPRAAAGETAITGPLFGMKMKAATGVPGQREAAILARAGLTSQNLELYPDLLSGTRRPYLIRPRELQVRAEADGLRWEFTLPPGVYATTLLEEVFELTSGQSGTEPVG
ncbi:tRNA pseudouridine(13) synthase TruD [bacterium]|nr:tRNA pseudouridine(13) synthase TruD [bacterium]